MKINVHLKANDAVKLPINQNYFLGSAVYKMLNANPDYASFLHDIGYLDSKCRRPFKLFVFSPLRCRERRILGDTIILGPERIVWSISSPMREFLTTFATGLLTYGKLKVCGAELTIDSINSAPETEITSRMQFICLSPIVVSKPSALGRQAEYLLNDSPEFVERIRLNLIHKYELVYHNTPKDDSFDMRFDLGYVSKRNGKITKLIDIKGIKIRGVLAPFTVSGSPELIKIGYECGFGERGSMGFGCVEMRQ